MSHDVVTHLLDSGVKLHLGCGQTRLGGWVNCDQTRHSPHVDEAFDLMGTWPYGDNCVSAVYASHVLEHLPAPLHFFRELWRVLMPMGRVLIRVPYGMHRSAWGDLTHLRPWLPECFACFQPGYDAAVGNPQHERWTAYFGLGTVDLRVDARLIRWLRLPFGARALCALAPYVPSVFEEVFADLYALKTPDAQAEYRATHVPNAVPLRYFVYRHAWEGRELQPGEGAQMHMLADGGAVLEEGRRGYR